MFITNWTSALRKHIWGLTGEGGPASELVPWGRGGDTPEAREQSLERSHRSLPRSEAQWGPWKRSPSPWGYSLNHTTEEGCQGGQLHIFPLFSFPKPPPTTASLSGPRPALRRFFLFKAHYPCLWLIFQQSFALLMV